MDLLEALTLSLFLGLGTARMAAIVSIDKIAEPLRDLVFHWSPPEDNDREGWYYQSMRKATPEERESMSEWDVPWYKKLWWFPQTGQPVVTRKPGFFGQLISCHRCTSVWIAFGNVALWYVWRDAALILNLGCAISFVASASDTHFYKR